jgi:uncharacterized protein (TIGR02145 family)
MKVFAFKILILVLVFICSCSKDEEQIQSGTFSDERDGTIYKTVKIGEQWWMAENLAYETEKGSYAYEDDENNVQKYGRLYTLDAAREACPDGWHLPSDNEWMQLGEYIENDRRERNIGHGITGIFVAGKYLKSKEGWGGAGTDYYGFNALPSGAYFNSGYGLVEESAFWWSDPVYSEHYDYFNLYFWKLEYGNSSLWHWGYVYISKYDRYSVRCVKD